MATHEKKNVDYFPFLCKEGKAMFYIETKYGNDGYATWIKILRQLAVTNDHWINFSDETELMFMAAKCKITEGKLVEIINDLSKMGEFNSTLWTENKIIYSEKFILNIQDAYSRRNNKCMQLKDLCIHLLNLGIHNDYNKPKNDIPNPYIIEYNSISEDRIENKEDYADEESALPEIVNAEEEKGKTASTEIVNAKPKKEKPPVSEKTRLLRAGLREHFLLTYEQKFKMKYYWTAKDAGALIYLIQKIEFTVKDKLPGIQDTDKETIKTFNHILSGIKDGWMMANFSMTLINSKFNEIINQIKTPNQTQNAKQRNQQGAYEANEFLERFNKSRSQV